MTNHPPLPLKEANLLHQLIGDFERYKHQGFIDAAHDVLRIVQRTCGQIIENPDLFKEETLLITSKQGEQVIVHQAAE